MVITPKLAFLLLALACFAASFFNTPRFNWQSGGFLFALLWLAV